MEARHEPSPTDSGTDKAQTATASPTTRLLWTICILAAAGLALVASGAGLGGGAPDATPTNSSAPSTGRPAGGGAPASSPSGRVVNVRDFQTDGRSDSAAILAAMGAARSGDTVYFPAGEFLLDQPVYFASNVTITGDPDNPPVLMGQGTVSLLLGNTRDHPLRNTTIRNLRFDNLELTLTGDASYSSIVDVTLKDCVFSNGRRAEPWSSDYVRLSYTLGVTIDGCTFLRDGSSGGRGVVLERTHGSVIKDSFFGTTPDLETGAPYGYFKTAINLLGYDAGTGDRNEDIVIDGNVFRRAANPPCPVGPQCEDHGIYVWGARDVFIGGNDGDGWTNTSTGGALKLRNSEDVTVTDNHFMGSGVLAYTYWHRSPRHLRDVRIIGNRLDMAGATGPGIFYRRADAEGSSASPICARSGGEAGIDIADNAFDDGGGIDIRCANGHAICVAGNTGAQLTLHASAVRTRNCASQGIRPFAGLFRGDFNGDGRQDFVRLAPSASGLAYWRVVLSAGDGYRTRQWRQTAALAPDADRYGLLVGDYNGDGRDDLAYRGTCATSRTGCWVVQFATDDGFTAPRLHLFDGVARTDETFRFGFHVGDFTGNHRDGIAFRGACGTDKHHCWVVLTNLDRPFLQVSDWGDGVYWAPPATDEYHLLVADYNGDGRTDIAYVGRCGGTVTCLRVHVSTGTEFVAEDWGDDIYVQPHLTAHFGMLVGDWNGDGRADIAYLGRCGNVGVPTWRFHLGAADRPFTLACSGRRDLRTPASPTR